MTLRQWSEWNDSPPVKQYRPRVPPYFDIRYKMPTNIYHNIHRAADTVAQHSTVDCIQDYSRRSGTDNRRELNSRVFSQIYQNTFHNPNVVLSKLFRL